MLNRVAQVQLSDLTGLGRSSCSVVYKYRVI